MFKSNLKLALIVLLFNFQQADGKYLQQDNIQPTSVWLPQIIFSPPAGVSFRETFDGTPTSPQPWKPSNWDVTVHSRNMETWEQLESMEAAHGKDCGKPPATHPVTNYQDAVYLCNDHMMTALNSSSYGVIYLTPDHLVDFSKGEAVIKFDLSTSRTSIRDWFDVWISPYDDHLQLPVPDFIPDLSGEPRRAINLQMDNFNRETTFRLNRIANFDADVTDGNTWIGYESFLTPSAMRRDTFELRISRTHIKFGMPAYNFWWFNTDIPARDWTVGVVQFGHHSYNPKKDCSGCGPNTWHWDNVSINPSVPFTIIRAAQRFTDAQNGAKVTFQKPAPANARLRFSGIGNNLQVSFNNGKTWQKAEIQAQEKHTGEAFWSYWTPVPVGTKTVLFKGQKWWAGNWRVKDLSIWSLTTK